MSRGKNEGSKEPKEEDKEEFFVLFTPKLLKESALFFEMSLLCNAKLNNSCTKSGYNKV